MSPEENPAKSNISVRCINTGLLNSWAYILFFFEIKPCPGLFVAVSAAVYYATTRGHQNNNKLTPMQNKNYSFL